MTEEISLIFGYRDSGYSLAICVNCKANTPLHEVNLPIIKTSYLKCDQCGDVLEVGQAPGVASIFAPTNSKSHLSIVSPSRGTNGPVGYTIGNG
jgi:hypothetical protein